MATSDDSHDNAWRRLYAAAPEDFLARRTELVAQAKRDGELDAARELGRARKPTVAAWVVNAYVLDQPDAVEQLRALGDELRAAQDQLAADRLRELATRRRELVRQLTGAALRAAGRANAPATLRDEVSGTFDAALADGEVAGRLGRLTAAQRWSGFGFSPDAAPQLTLVPGGRASGRRVGSTGAAGRQSAAPAQQNDEPQTAKPPAEQKAARRAIEVLQRELDEIDAEIEVARAQETRAKADADRAKRALAEASFALDAAQHETADARARHSDGRRRRRAAQHKLDRARRGR